MKIAIIGAGQMARIIAEKASTMHVTVYCFAWEQGAVAKDYADYFFPISIFEKDTILNICRENQIDGVVATTELTIAIAAYIAQNMGLNTNPLAVAEHVTQKNWVRNKIIHAKWIHQPQFMLLTEMQEAQTDKITQYPVIVKPVSEGGKRGITVVYSAEELENALQEAFSVDRANNGVIIEEYLMKGCEYSVEGLSYHGEHQIIQITEKLSSGPPHCVELGHDQPANISLDMREQVIAAVKELLTSVGIVNGCTHTEIKIIDGKVYLIELNARPGGDHISYPLTELSTGYDYIGEIIHAALDIQPAKRDSRPYIKYAGVRFVAKQTAYLEDIFANCDNEPWLYKKHVETEELQEISHNDCDHLNYFIYCADSRPALDKGLREGEHL